MFTARVSRRSEYLGIEVETYGTLLMWIRSYVRGNVEGSIPPAGPDRASRQFQRSRSITSVISPTKTSIISCEEEPRENMVI